MFKLLGVLFALGIWGTSGMNLENNPVEIISEGCQWKYVESNCTGCPSLDQIYSNLFEGKQNPRNEYCGIRLSVGSHRLSKTFNIPSGITIEGGFLSGGPEWIKSYSKGDTALIITGTQVENPPQCVGKHYFRKRIH
jgi:hypothetical protein